MPTNQSKKEKLLKFNEEKLRKAIGESWYKALFYGRDNNVRVDNIVAITSKDTMKTSVSFYFLMWAMANYDWANAFVLRDTIKNSSNEQKTHIRNTLERIEKEHNMPEVSSLFEESNNAYYLVRDKKSKRNQKMTLTSFEDMVRVGGFSTSNSKPGIFFYDELQNPNSSLTKLKDEDAFLADFKFINGKNFNNILATKVDFPKWLPKNLFMSNRYVADHALNKFAEECFPFEDKILDDGSVSTGIMTKMLTDPAKYNFFVKYIGEDNCPEKWWDFKYTLILYANQLSHPIFRLNEEWRNEKLDLIKRGKPEDLAMIVGALYEGIEHNKKAYNYKRITKIKQEEFDKYYKPYAIRYVTTMDLDFSRQIIFRTFVVCCKYICGIPIYRVVRYKKNKISCKGVGKDGANTYDYYLQTKEIMTKIKAELDTFLKDKKIDLHVFIDDKQGQWVGQLNYGEFQRGDIKFFKIDFDRAVPIVKRPAMTDQMQDNGFLVDIESPHNDTLHKYYQTTTIDQSSVVGKRLERDNDQKIDDINTDEYAQIKLYAYFIWDTLSTSKLAKLGVKNEW